MPRPGKRRRLTGVDLHESEELTALAKRLCGMLADRHKDDPAFAACELMLDQAEGRLHTKAETADAAPDSKGEELPL